MPGKRIPALPAIAGASTANDDNLVIYDTDAGETKRILRSQLAAGLVGDLPYTPSGGISATTVPTAIAELDSEKVAFTRLDDNDGSSLVGYLPAGLGAVSTTVQAKLRETVSVKDFGAVGDGVTDDTDEIRAAVNAIGSAQTLIFPAATYVVTGSITVASNKSLDLGGATISYTGAIYVFTITGSNVAIKGGEISGPDAGAYVPDSGAVKAWGTDNGAAVAPTRLSNIVIDSMKVNNVGEAAFEGRYLSNVTVKNCTFTNLGYIGAGFLHSNNCRVKGNYIDTIAGETSSGELNAYGIYFSGIDNADAVRYPPCEDCTAVNNEIRNIPTWMAFLTKSGQRVAFTHNSVFDCRRGACITWHGDNQATDCVIAFNTFQNNLPRTNNPNGSNRQDAAIWDIGKSLALPTLRTRIEYNDIYQHGAGIGTGGAIVIEFANDGVCANNTLVESWGAGIVLAQYLVNYSIVRNTIIDSKSSGVGASPAMAFDNAKGIWFRSANFTNVKCAGNVFIRRNTSLELYVLTFAYFVPNTPDKTIDFKDDIFEGFTAANLRFSFSGDLSGLTGDIEYDFTGTLTGCTTSPTGTVRSKVKNGIATLHIPVLSGTSNTTSMFMTGMPHWLRPNANRWSLVPGQNNSVPGSLICQVSDTADQLVFHPGWNNSSSFTASNTKGVWFSTVTYAVRN